MITGSNSTCCERLPCARRVLRARSCGRTTPQSRRSRQSPESRYPFHVIWLDEGGRQHGLRLVAPPPALIHAVEHLWVHPALPKRAWRVVPDVSAYLIFSLLDTSAGLRADCRVVGARNRYCDIDVGERTLTIGIRLRPGALPCLLRD